MTNPASQDPRQEVFRTLVAAQDGGLSVTASREQTARQFDMSVSNILEIERAGITQKWPPLGPAVSSERAAT